MRIRIKICCIATPEEARMAIDSGADALGLVGNMPSGPGPIADELIASIARTILPPVSSFLLTSEQTASGIISHLKKTNTGTVQIVDTVKKRVYDDIRMAIPSMRIVQVIHISGNESIDLALKTQQYVDALLLDSGNPNAAIKTLGGTGNIHDWEISRQLVKEIQVPVFLAGGLHAGNVKQAIDQVQPFAVDVCSGVRTNGKLDPFKLDAFVKAVYSV